MQKLTILSLAAHTIFSLRFNCENSSQKSRFKEKIIHEIRVFNKAHVAKFRELAGNDTWDFGTAEMDAQTQYKNFHDISTNTTTLT